MPLIPVAPGSLLETVLKAADVDPEGTQELVRLGLYETMADELDRIRPLLDDLVGKSLDRTHDDVRRELVRQAVAKRLDGQDLDEVLLTAAQVTLLEGAVSKADDQGRAPKGGKGKYKGGQFLPKGQSGGAGAGPPSQPVRNARWDQLAAYAGDAKDSRLMRDVESGVRESSGTDRAAYRRMKLAGRALGAATGYQGPAGAVGAVAQLAGELGPEAERVLSPGIRRTAYRYRGTEKRPDVGLVREVAAVDEDTIEAFAGDPNATADFMRRQDVRNGGATAALMAYSSDLKDMTAEQAAMRVRGDVAASYLLTSRAVPSPERTEISIAAGRTPPSRGVMIDADGDVVSEAMGINGDHYLPFDLKNLRRLSGGQYVRTRAAGGPTTEDVYTGLMSNARQVQVVSNSGVFTMEFDPDLRGGRRYNDKARQMVTRYGEILSAINSSRSNGLFAQDIDDRTRGEIRRKALTAASGDEDEADIHEATLLSRARAEAMVTDPEEVMEAEIETRLAAELRTRTKNGTRLTPRQTDQLREAITGEVIDNADKKRVRRYRLDGEGYGAALQTLQEEFPFFIRSVDFQPLPEFMRTRGVRGSESQRRSYNATDRGFVAPGGLLTAGSNRETMKIPPRQQQAAQTQQGATGVAASTTPANAGTGSVAASGQTAQQGAPRTLETALVEHRKTMKLSLANDLRSVKSVLSGLSGITDMDVSEASDAQALSALSGANYLNWLVNTKGEGKLEKAGEFLASEGPESRHRAKTVEAVNSTISEIRNEFLDESNKARMETMISGLDNLAARVQVTTIMADPFDVVANPVMHIPSIDNPKPARHEDISALGADPKNYEAFERRIAEIDPHLLEEINTFSDLEDEDIAQTIMDDMQHLRAAIAWGQNGGEKPPNVAMDLAEAQALVKQPESNAHYKAVARMQKAWSYVRARELMNELKGGGAAPLAPAPAAHEQTQKRHHPVVKRHLPGSPAAEALSQLLAALRT